MNYASTCKTIQSKQLPYRAREQISKALYSRHTTSRISIVYQFYVSRYYKDSFPNTLSPTRNNKALHQKQLTTGKTNEGISNTRRHVSYNIEKLCPSVSILERSELIKCLLKCKRYLKELTMFSIGSKIKLLRQMFTLTYCVNTMENTMFYIDYIELVSLEKST